MYWYSCVYAFFPCSLQKYLKEWKSRKRNFKDLQDEICEGTDKNPQEFREIVGIETDEDFKVVQIEAVPGPSPSLFEKQSGDRIALLSCLLLFGIR